MESFNFELGSIFAILLSIWLASQFSESVLGFLFLLVLFGTCTGAISQTDPLQEFVGKIEQEFVGKIETAVVKKETPRIPAITPPVVEKTTVVEDAASELGAPTESPNFGDMRFE